MPAVIPTPASVLVEDDPFTRIVGVVLDPDTARERIEAYSDFFSHDLPDFEGWVSDLRKRLGRLYPARVRLAADEEAWSAGLAEAEVAIAEGRRVGTAELARAPRLRIVQKFGTITSNIDEAACAVRGVHVRTLRRRANMACAEHALGLMLALARRICATDGLVSIEQLRAAGYAPRMFDRRHTANSNWARIPGLRTLHGATLGIVGLGEIGRELAVRAAACGMQIVYCQRRRLDPDEETRFGNARYADLDALLAAADYVSLHLPSSAATARFIGEAQFSRMKPGAILVNVSRAELVDRDALLATLAGGRLGGYATDTPYGEPGDAADPLLEFGNVIVTPHIAAQPRFNALSDFEEMLTGIDAALA